MVMYNYPRWLTFYIVWNKHITIKGGNWNLITTLNVVRGDLLQSPNSYLQTSSWKVKNIVKNISRASVNFVFWKKNSIHNYNFRATRLAPYYIMYVKKCLPNHNVMLWFSWLFLTEYSLRETLNKLRNTTI
jgi:hypothetical protein